MRLRVLTAGTLLLGAAILAAPAGATVPRTMMVEEFGFFT